MKTHPIRLLALTAVLAAIIPGGFAAAQTNLSPAAGPTITPGEITREDGFVAINGQTHVVRNGVATPLVGELTLRITPEGIIGFDQITRKLTPDAMLTMDGRLITAPANITVAPAVSTVPGPSVSPAGATTEVIDPNERFLGRGVSGQNTSGLAPPPPPSQSRSEEGAARPVEVEVRIPAVPIPDTNNPNAVPTSPRNR